MTCAKPPYEQPQPFTGPESPPDVEERHPVARITPVVNGKPGAILASIAVDEESEIRASIQDLSRLVATLLPVE